MLRDGGAGGRGGPDPGDHEGADEAGALVAEAAFREPGQQDPAVEHRGHVHAAASAGGAVDTAGASSAGVAGQDGAGERAQQQSADFVHQRGDELARAVSESWS